MADGADYVDMEMDIADKIPRYRESKRIISYHNFGRDQDCHQGEQTGRQRLRAATVPRFIDANRRILHG